MEKSEVDALLQQGQSFQQAGELDRARECYRKLLAQHPEHAQAQYSLGHLLGVLGYAHQGRGEIPAAIDCYLEALALAPRMARIRNNLGNAYRLSGRMEEALAAFREAIELEPGLAEAHLNFAIALHQDGESGQALAHCRRAIQIDSRFAEAHLNLGFLLEQEGDVRGAAASYAEAMRVRPDFAEAHFNRALQFLLAGEFAAGWEAYEWRNRLPGQADAQPYRGWPRWDGSPLEGKAILLYAEQGFGDAIQFVRYAPLVAQRGGRVTVVCSPKLKALFQSAQGVSAVLSAGEPGPAPGLCCSLMSLPRLFGTTLETIPAQVPYLSADPAKALRWRERLAAEDASPKVGLFWSTEARSAIAQMKSLSLGSLAPLGAVPGVVFFSLQRGAAAIEASQPPAGMKIRDLTGELRDFADDAALISNLDLVISIDTATAHLAGALGKPVWTLTHFPPEWRWLLGRDDSPWYPSMRLFRQGRDEPWESVLARVLQALRRHVA